MYKCTSCDYTAEEAGQCPHCNVDLVAEETTTEEDAPAAEATETTEKAASTEEAAPAEGEVTEKPKEEDSAV